MRLSTRQRRHRVLIEHARDWRVYMKQPPAGGALSAGKATDPAPPLASEHTGSQLVPLAGETAVNALR